MKLDKNFFMILICFIILLLSSNTIASEGRYKYVEYDNAYGELLLHNTKAGLTIHIETANDYGSTCEFDGVCQYRDGKIICVSQDVIENHDYFIGIEVHKNILKIIHYYPYVCGMRGNIDGKYIKQ